MTKSNAIQTDDSLEEELLQLVARQARRVSLPILLTAALIASFASQYTPFLVWSGWLCLAIFMLVGRWVILNKLVSFAQHTISRRINIVVMINIAHGLTYSASLSFFPYFSELERAIQTILLLGLCTGAVSTTVGYRPFLLVFLIPILVSVSLMWAFSPGHSTNHVPESIVSLLVLMFGGVLFAMATDAFRLFKESFEIRLQQIALNHKLQSALEEAETANRSKTRFLAAASHDLRQPIHTLSLFSAALDMQPLNEKTREITGHMNTALQALASQLDALLDISKLDANIISVNMTPVNIQALVNRLGQEMKPLAKEKALDYQLDCSQEYVINSDEILLERILRNLITNAIKYTDQGSVTIKISDHGQRLFIEVTDTGYGIDKQDLTRIFEEFYQVANPERDRSKGLGLGLAIVKRLTKMLNIELSILSKSEHGSTFTLSIPFAAAIQEELPEKTEPGASWNNLNVLVVDDEESVQLGMKVLLESWDCQVSLADGTTSAIEAAQQHTPDIVLADFRLRDNDTGIQTIQALMNVFPDLPAILISGDTAPDRLQEAKAAGIPFLHKPVSPDALKQAMTEAL